MCVCVFTITRHIFFIDIFSGTLFSYVMSFLVPNLQKVEMILNDRTGLL